LKTQAGFPLGEVLDRKEKNEGMNYRAASCKLRGSDRRSTMNYKKIINTLLTIIKRLLIAAGIIAIVALTLYLNAANIVFSVVRMKSTEVMDNVFLVPDDMLEFIDKRIAFSYKKVVYLSQDVYEELQKDSLLGKFILAHETGHTFQVAQAWYDDIDDSVRLQDEVEADIYACKELHIAEAEYLDIRMNKIPTMMAVLEDRVFHSDDEDPFKLYSDPEYLSQYEIQAEQVIQAVYR
jgi:hypothetical protein